MINFNELEEKELCNFYGGEGKTVAATYCDELNRIMKGRLCRGASIGLHKHETSSEIVYILAGTAKVVCDGKEELLRAGDCHYCKKGSSHTVINTGDDDLFFFAVVPQQ